MPGQRSPDNVSVTITMRKDLRNWIDDERRQRDVDRSTFIRGIIYDARPDAPRGTNKKRGRR